MTNNNKFKLLRQQMGMSQVKLAEFLNMSPGSIYKYEKGIHSPRLDILEKMEGFTSQHRKEGDKDMQSTTHNESSLESRLKDKETIIGYMTEEIASLKIQLNNKQVEATHWEGLECDFVAKVGLKIKNFKMVRTILDITNYEVQALRLGYSIDELSDLWSIGEEYTGFSTHPIDKIMTKETKNTLDRIAHSLPIMLDTLKSMVGNHYIPVPLVYIHKNKKHIPAITYNKVLWADGLVYSKVQFLNT
ncbi:MAG: hypothetical protein Unbinned6224contig1001_48 [Prokaryotic dsDNA virus sp.]|nr:MAG: hypothetical protein Unbinned6224contig1001_48 [Prokaryotic dsDNA virus sp.]|tara:strand:+ start:10079 stop:10816 length:738 start_codon:yes stop_codon:yes gene_type:complete